MFSVRIKNHIYDFKVNQISKITVKTKFDDTNIVISANETEDAFLPCEPNGNPAPTITWFFEDDPILMEDFEEHNMELAEDGLYIRNVTLFHQGTYKCRAHQQSKLLTDTTEKTFTFRINCE